MTLRKHRSGFSLIELMVSVAIMAVAIAATVSVVISLSSMTRNAEIFGDDEDRVRTAAGDLQKAIEAAGLLTPQGIYVNGSSIKPILVNPVFGLDGTGAGFGTGGALTPDPYGLFSDDLWIVVPDRNAFREGCVDQGAGVVISSPTGPGAGPISVQCAAVTTFGGNDFLVAATSRNGTLLSPPLTFAGGQIDFAESGIGGYPPSGFNKGDLVYRVQVMHYFIKVNPVTNARALMRHPGVVGTDAANRPFVDAPAPAADEVVMDYIEDMQIKYGTDPALAGVPGNYVFQDGFPPNYSPTVPLRTVRINLVAIGKQRNANTRGDSNSGANVSVLLAPLPQVENHTGAVVPDGYRRTLFVQRIELPNTSPESL